MNPVENRKSFLITCPLCHIACILFESLGQVQISETLQNLFPLYVCKDQQHIHFIWPFIVVFHCRGICWHCLSSPMKVLLRLATWIISTQPIVLILAKCCQTERTISY